MTEFLDNFHFLRPWALLLLLLAVGAFFWAVDHDQFDDMETPGLLPLDDEERKP